MTARLLPARIDRIIDGVELRRALTAAAQAQPSEAKRRPEVLRLLRDALRRGRATARMRLEAGAGGVGTARLLAEATDDVLTALYDYVTIHVVRASNPTEGERIALMAVGGYGRGALAPFSDLDLLFLRPYKATAHTESVIEYILYVLWDLGFKVGHASRTVEECIRFARDDFTISTSLLEARRLAGDEALAAELKRRYRRDVMQGAGQAFVAAKLAERDHRHQRAGASRYMVEPNVKEGKGGLRDLNTLFWIAQYLYPSDEPAEIVRLKEFTGREVKAFLRAFDFLWAVRCHMHFVTGRAEERLTFDLQPEIARRMGYDFGPEPEPRLEIGSERDEVSVASDPSATSDEASQRTARMVERFMRRYFLIAREVGSLTRTFCAQLEAEQAKRPQGLSRFWLRRGGPETPRRLLAPGFYEDAGRLAVEPMTFERTPVELIRVFGLADRHNLDLHPDAFALVNRSLNLIGAKLRRDRHAARAFLRVLAHGRDTYRTLTLMNESGVLGRYLPEFGRIVGQMQFNMYHAYTTDEHTLRAVGVIADIAAGRLADEHPLAVSIMPLVADPEALFLAMLLHDTGKGGAPGGQTLAGARNARQACERLGLSEERIELVAWLVQNHLAMSDFAQKRDISDPRTITAFARLVENPERLRSLAILTAADIRAVGPGVWNGWKGQLLRELYTVTEALFRGGRISDVTAEHVEDIREALAANARRRFVEGHGDAADSVAAWAGSMEDSYFVAFPSRAQACHYALSLRAKTQGGAAAAADLMYDGHATEITLSAQDRRGLFADLCGAMAAFEANIAGARVYTSSSGEALDIFYIQDRHGEPFGRDDAASLDRLTQALEAVARGDVLTVERRRVDYTRTAAFAVAPSVALDNDASDAATVVEVSGRDRPGLLQSLSRTLANAGLSVQSAHVENYGERAVDAFYVIDDQGDKLADPDRIAGLKAALTAVLLEAEPEVRRARDRASQRAASTP
jgi:[protein-PII] uridylyltransferase